MAEGQGGDGKRPARWARYQIVGAFVAFVVGVGLFIVQGVDRLLWGVDLDFGALPWGLTVLSVYVLFGVSLPQLLGRGPGEDKP